jgi:rfaE bifunctional protein kinase chain/domain
MSRAQTIEMMSFEDFKASMSRVEGFVKAQTGTGQHQSKSKILVLGDVGLDQYLYGAVERISPEAPVPVVNLNKKEKKLGLAANVGKNLSSMGASCDLVGLVGSDQAGEDIRSLLGSWRGMTAKLVVSPSRPTTEKTRVLSGQHHLLRLDEEDSSGLTAEEKKMFFDHVEALNFADYSHVILEDYGKGVLFEELCQKVISKAHESGALVLVDPSKKAPIQNFKGADFFKPNYNETLAYSDKAGTENYKELLDWIISEGEFKNLVSTLGALGMSLKNSEQTLRVPTFARKVFDVTGAGDTVIAALAFGLNGGLSTVEACLFANFAAGYVVGKVGAVPCSLEDIESHMERFSSSEISLKFQDNIC